MLSQSFSSFFALFCIGQISHHQHKAKCSRTNCSLKWANGSDVFRTRIYLYNIISYSSKCRYFKDLHIVRNYTTWNIDIMKYYGIILTRIILIGNHGNCMSISNKSSAANSANKNMWLWTCDDDLHNEKKDYCHALMLHFCDLSAKRE